MLKLTVLVKRHPSLSVEEFHERWREHGRTIGREPAFRNYIRRYEQHHRVPDDYHSWGAVAPDPAGKRDTYDGMALQWFDRYDDFVGFISDPAYAEKIGPDEETLLDMKSLVVIFTEDAEVYIP